MTGHRQPKVPGAGLHTAALRLFGRPFAERFLFPAIADLQHEIRDASTLGRAHRAVVASRAYLAFWRTTALCALHVREPGSAAVLRPALALLAAAVVLSLIEMAPVIWTLARALGTLHSRTVLELFALLSPQALVVTLPVGTLFAALWEYRRRPAWGQSPVVTARAVLAVALAAGGLSLLTMVWIVPEANQVFREKAYRAVVLTSGASSPYAAPLEKGPPEMSAAELRQARLFADASPRLQVTYDWYLHQKTAVPAAAVVFALVAIGAGPRRTARWSVLRAGSLTVAVTLVYYAIFTLGKVLALREVIPAFAGVWAANAAIGGAALLGLCSRLCRSRPETAGRF